LDKRALAAFCQELRIVSSVFSPHVCLFMGACTHDPLRLMIVTELMKTDLKCLLGDKEAMSSLTPYCRMVIARDAALGLAWLHGAVPMVIHRDVKPSNFLIDDNMRCKITDFGLSQFRHAGERLVDHAGANGTPLYMAREVLDGAPFTEKSDIYSFGLVLWELVTGELPYANLDTLSNDAFADIICGGHRPVLPADIPPTLCSLIKECWADDPLARPTAMRVAEQLADIAFKVAILDESARAFWHDRFGVMEQVLWREAEPAFLEFFGAIGKSSRAAHVHALLSKMRDHGRDIVTLEWFGSVVDWFGPLTVANLRDMYATLVEKWFHGELSTCDAERMLGDKASGTFLVRFSTQSRGSFTISRVATNNAIHHLRVQHHPLQADFSILNRHYTSLRDMIVGETNALVFARPCSGSMFRNVFQQRSIAAPSNDAGQESNIWLNEAAASSTAVPPKAAYDLGFLIPDWETEELLPAPDVGCPSPSTDELTDF
jgi:hypothetical protein